MNEPANNLPASVELSERELDAFDSVANSMESAEHAIDLQFGTGYAEKHPMLIASYLQAVAITYLANTIGAGLHRALGALGGLKPTAVEVSSHG